jgi:hypothetical protein
MISNELTLALVNHLWQSTVVVLMAWALRKNHARVRYRVWVAASVEFLVPFSVPISAGEWVRPLVPVTAVARPAIAKAIEGVTLAFDQTHFVDTGSSPMTTRHRNWLAVMLIVVQGCGVSIVAFWPITR